jgi:alkylation response protein AidB-like acyl-CoA dehydrogenase
MENLETFPYPRNRLTEADSQLASALLEMLRREVANRRVELKESYKELLRPALKKVMLEIGLQRMFFPESLGGDGHGTPRAAYTVAAAMEALGWADTGLAYLAAHNLALQALLALEGSTQEDSLARFAPLFCRGEEPLVVSFILPVFGEDGDFPTWRGRSFQVIARLTRDGFSLSGRKVRPTCSGVDADLFGVWCHVEGEEEPAFILVPGDAPGLSRGPELKKTGLAASRQAELDLTGTEVPGGNCVFRGGEGLRHLLSWYYLGIAASVVGGLLAAHGILREWGDNRVIKGRGNLFRENPLTGAVMGEIAQDISVSRLLTYNLAEALAEPASFGDAGSEEVYTLALLVVHQVLATGERALHRTMELMASAGYAKEWQLERYWRDLKTVQCYVGSHELAKHDFARRFFGARTL